jgi:predicted RND superfamily exporter protein
MKDCLIGFLSGILLSFGLIFWMGGFKIIGITSILISQFLLVIVCGHYKYIKNNLH